MEGRGTIFLGRRLWGKLDFQRGREKGRTGNRGNFLRGAGRSDRRVLRLVWGMKWRKVLGVVRFGGPLGGKVWVSFGASWWFGLERGREMAFFRRRRSRLRVGLGRLVMVGMFNEYIRNKIKKSTKIGRNSGYLI